MLSGGRLKRPDGYLHKSAEGVEEEKNVLVYFLETSAAVWH